MNLKAKNGELDPVCGREKEIEFLEQILVCRNRNNAMITGEAGVGKTAIVYGLVEQLISGTNKGVLQNKRFIQLLNANVLAGTKREEGLQRLGEILHEIAGFKDQVILLVDNIQVLFEAGERGSDVLNFLKAAISEKQVQVIATASTNTFKDYFSEDEIWRNNFQRLICDEPSMEQAEEMVKAVSGKYEKFHEVTFTDDIFFSSVSLARKYISDRRLPGKAIDILDRVAASVRLKHSLGKDRIQKSM